MRYLPTKPSLDEIWKTIEEYGIDRESLEKTAPDDELIFKIYTALKAINEKEQELQQMTC